MSSFHVVLRVLTFLSAFRGLWRHCRILVPAVLVASCLFVPIRPGKFPRIKASWKEKGAYVVSFSPDGLSLLSSGSDDRRLRDSATGKVRAVLSNTDSLFGGLTFSPDSQLLYAGVDSKRHAPFTIYDLNVWTVATGKVHGTFPYLSDHLNADKTKGSGAVD